MHALNRYRNSSIVPALFSEHIEPEPRPSHWARRRNREFLLNETRAATCRRIGLAAFSHLKTALSGIIGMKNPAKGGFCSFTDDLSAAHLADAYSRGLFADSGLLRTGFRAPDQRRILDLTTYVPAQQMPQPAIFTYDTHIDYVIARCNAARTSKYAAKLLLAFAALGDTGLLHSVEMRTAKGTLCGGLFGIATGRVFVVHGIFAQNAADKALIVEHLLRVLREKTFILADLTPVAALSHHEEQVISGADFALCAATDSVLLRMERWTNGVPAQKSETSESSHTKMAA